jgi:hypothetical protein
LCGWLPIGLTWFLHPEKERRAHGTFPFAIRSTQHTTRSKTSDARPTL